MGRKHYPQEVPRTADCLGVIRPQHRFAGRVQHSRDVSRSASLPQRILRVAEAIPVVRRRPRSSLTHHSDHGSQYKSGNFREVCVDAIFTISMGDCYENGMAEIFFDTLETELIDRQPRGRMMDQAKANSTTFDYLEGFYNTRRLHSTLGYLSPLES